MILRSDGLLIFTNGQLFSFTKLLTTVSVNSVQKNHILYKYIL